MPTISEVYLAMGLMNNVSLHTPVNDYDGKGTELGHLIKDEKSVNPEDLMIAIESKDAIWKIVDQLPAIQGKIVRLSFIKEWNDELIALELGISEARVKFHKGRAKRILRNKLYTFL